MIREHEPDLYSEDSEDVLPVQQNELEESLSLNQEKRSPEANMTNKLEGLFYFLGKVTRRNDGKLESSKSERPLSVRRERAKLYKLFKKTKDPEERKRIIQEARDRDEALRGFLNQGEVSMSDPELGQAKARFTILKPSQEKELKDKPPIVLIPGISNDLACVETLGQELSLSGHKVIVVGYPESFMGEVSQEFVDKCKESDSYAPHAKFFENAIDQIVSQEGNIELWGFSTGGPISAEMLSNNPRFSQRVTRAVLVNPSGSVEQNQRQLMTGLAGEVKGLISGDAAKFVMTTGREVQDNVEPQTPDHLKKRDEVFATLMERISHRSQSFDTMQVQEQGDIIVVSYDNDNVTKSKRMFSMENPPHNPNIKKMTLSGYHSTPLLKPKELIERVGAIK